MEVNNKELYNPTDYLVLHNIKHFASLKNPTTKTNSQ